MSELSEAEFRHQRTTFIPGVPDAGDTSPPPAAIQPAALTVDEGVVVGGVSGPSQDQPQAADGGPTPPAPDTLGGPTKAAEPATPDPKSQESVPSGEAVDTKVSPQPEAAPAE